ncbi:PH domain-containing protein [Phthorimaea operculella]|nr:PH domain-containing protein [Phthorimaea operculella]
MCQKKQPVIVNNWDAGGLHQVLQILDDHALDPPPQSEFQMENKKAAPATQQPISQQHLMAHHVHPEQIYSQQPMQTLPQQPPTAHSAPAAPSAPSAPQPNGTAHLMHQPYHTNATARSPLLENRHELYGTQHQHANDYQRHYGANDNYNYPQSPPTRLERTDLYMDHNVNHELLHNIPKGYNAEVYQDYLKRNPPKDTNQIYQNHQPTYRPNMNQQYGSKPYLPFSNRIGPQSNTELLRRQYNEIQQMKLQQQMHYQNQAQMQQQQKFAERQILLQQIHGVQPPPNLQNSIYSDSSYRDLDRYSSKNDFKEYSSADIQKDVDRYAKNNEYKEFEKQPRQYQESQWQSNQPDLRDTERYRKQSEGDKSKSQSPPEFSNQSPARNNVGVVSPMSPVKSSESSSPSVKSPSSESRRSSGGGQALRSPVAQRSPSAPVALAGILYKQGSDGLKVWRKRWFVLSEYCLFYYKSQDEEKLLGSVLLPSYNVSACTAEDKVLRKYAFKLEHANMRTYILAAPDQDAMMKWVKALTMAALMQTPNEQAQKQNDRAKTEDDDGVPGPTYANAPPKPRRSNEGYNSPSPDMYDPNYDLLKKPASHYSQGTSHTRNQDHPTYQTSQESTYTRGPQSPPPPQPAPPPAPQPQYQKRAYDAHNLSLPLTNTVTDRLENHQPTTNLYRSNPQSPYFDNRNRPTQQLPPDTKQEQIYDRQSRNPFLQDMPPQTSDTPKDDLQSNTRSSTEQDRARLYNETYGESRTTTKSNSDATTYNRDVYGELNTRPVNRSGSAINERLLIERRTPEAYGRAASLSGYGKGKMGDYEDVYAAYAAENEYGKTYAQSPPQSRDAVSLSSQHQPQDYTGNYGQTQEKTFSGPSVLRRKKMQSSGIQPPMPRPHSADFLEYEAKNEMLNKTMPPRNVCDPPRQPQRPKSSLDINSYYDPSSDRYYSEESYAEKMRQSAQYLQQAGMAPRNIQIPLAKYASGLAEKQLNSPYSQVCNNNYETEFGTNRITRDNASFSKYSDLEGLNSNWMLKEKENQKDYANRSGSVMSDGSNAGFKEASRYDHTADSFMRSASARLPSSTEKDGEKKVQQREESMKRLLEWKQRMLQSPLTRKSTPATISLARSLNQSRQSLRSDQYKPKGYANVSYNSYSSDDEEEASGTDLQKPREMQAGRSNRMNLTSPIIMRPITAHASVTALPKEPESPNIENEPSEKTFENTYENVLCSINMPSMNLEDDEMGEKEACFEKELTQETNEDKSIQKIEDLDGYETEDSEAESEAQIEYTDNDLDEVLLESDTDAPMKCEQEDRESKCKEDNCSVSEDTDQKPETPPVRSPGEDHYLPMSPRKVSTIEPAHKTILQNLSGFDQSIPHGYEDNPYVEMNVGNDEEDMQTYEIVCVNNGKVEPVYMELNNLVSAENESDGLESKPKIMLDTASNFADTKDHTLKRASKSDKNAKDKYDCSDADDEACKDMSLDAPFSRFSISDNFRPASYYLSSSRNVSDVQDSSDSEVFTPSSVPNSSPACEELSDEALSRYILDKLDKSDMSHGNSILKMLTSENQKMNTVKRKTTSLMIYGSRTSIHDTLSRGEKIRNSRASLTNDRKLNETSPNILNNSLLEQYHSSSIESDSLRSYNADRGSSRVSLESDISSKFEVAPSNISSELTSLNECDAAVDLRYPTGSKDSEMMLKRRPLSDDSLFELNTSELCLHNDANDIRANVDFDQYLDNLQPTRTPELTVQAKKVSSNIVRSRYTLSSMSMSGANVDLGTNSSSNQQSLSKKAFLGSNTSIGRNMRDANIPVRAVSPRVRWVEEKQQNDHYGSQQMSTSQQNLHNLSTNEDSWATARTPSRAQQPIRAVSPRIRRNTENDDLAHSRGEQLGDVPTAGELLGRTHEELVLLLIQLRRRHAATHRAIEHCCTQIHSVEDCLGSLKAMEREESLQRLEQLKMQLMELEHQYEKSKPLVQLVDNMVKLGSLYNRPGSTVERLERNQRLRQKVLAEHALEQQRWLESAAAGKPLETEAARARVAELWALEQELADEAAILQGLKTDKDAIESLLTGVRSKLDTVPRGSVSDLANSMGGLDMSGGLSGSRLGMTESLNGSGLGMTGGLSGSRLGMAESLNGGLSMSSGLNTSGHPTGAGLEAELTRVHAMLAHNSKKLEQTVADNARLERELQQLRRALQARRSAPHPPHTSHPTALLEDEVSRVQQLVSALQRQRQELSRAVRHLTQQSHALQNTHDAMPGKQQQRRPQSSWQETNLDTGLTIDHNQPDYYETPSQLQAPGHYPPGHYAPGHYPPDMETPLYVDTRGTGSDVTSPLNSEDLQHSGFANLSNVEKQEIKTVRIVKRESERRQRDRERSLQPMSEWPNTSLTANLDQFLEEELMQNNYSRASSLPRTDFSKFEEYYSKPSAPEPPNYLRLNDKNMELSPKYPSSPSLSNYDYSREISSLSSSYNKSYDRSGYDRTISLSTQYLNSPTDSAKTLTNDPLSKTSSVMSLTRSHMELSPIFKSEAAKQIITEMSGDGPKTGSLHRRQVPKEKRRHYTAPHHLSAKTLNEMPKDANQDKLGRSLDDADMERALRAAPAPDVVRSALPTRYADSIDQLLAAPQKILIPERYIPEQPPELSPEEQQKRQEKVESIKKMLSGTPADPTSKSPDGEEKRQREHLLQMNQILAKQVTEMSKIIAGTNHGFVFAFCLKALEEIPQQDRAHDLDDRSPDVELPIYQQRDNFFT